MAIKEIFKSSILLSQNQRVLQRYYTVNLMKYMSRVQVKGTSLSKLSFS